MSSEPIVPLPEVVYALVKGSKQEEAEEIVELANKDEISGSIYVSLPKSSLFGSLLTSLYVVYVSPSHVSMCHVGAQHCESSN